MKHRLTHSTARQARRCPDCSADISSRRANAIRCTECAAAVCGKVSSGGAIAALTTAYQSALIDLNNAHAIKIGELDQAKRVAVADHARAKMDLRMTFDADRAEARRDARDTVAGRATQAEEKKLMDLEESLELQAERREWVAHRTAKGESVDDAAFADYMENGLDGTGQTVDFQLTARDLDRLGVDPDIGGVV